MSYVLSSVTKVGSALIAGLVALGCSARAGEDDVASTQSALGGAATLTFDGAWNERASAVLERGTTVHVVYDASRLTACRGELYGSPAWGITGFWRVGAGPVRTFEAGGHSAASGGAEPAFTIDASGDLEVWFQNTNRWGCSGYDSNEGANYRFAVQPAASDPGWIGSVQYAIDRMTCNGICDSSLRPIDGEISYGTWARQRAAIRVITFEVWKDGVTNWDNPDRWRQLDVQVHTRVGTTGAFTSSYVGFDRRVGNNARYAIDLRALDPLPGSFTIQNVADCPSYPLNVSSDGGYVEAVVELYATVNGVEVRPAGAGTVYRARFSNYKGLYQPCVP